MRVIVIEEARFGEFLALMEGKTARNDTSLNRPAGLTNEQWQKALDAGKRELRYEFVTWAQSHGASCERR